jgi:anti-sigma factor RsiW
MSCNYRTKDYVEYLTGELEEQLRSSLEEHLPRCLRCRAELEAYSRVLQGLETLPDKEPPWNLTESVIRALFPRPATQRGRRGVFEKVATVLAAQALIVTFFIAIRGLASRSAVSAWNTLSEGMSGILETGREALALITSLNHVLEAAGNLLSTMVGALDSAAFWKAAVPSEALLLVIVFMMLTTGILWRLVGHPLPRAEREVRHVR